jgi:hypothetical protein
MPRIQEFFQFISFCMNPINTALFTVFVPLRGRQPQVHGRSVSPHKQVEKLNRISFLPGTSKNTAGASEVTGITALPMGERSR